MQIDKVLSSQIKKFKQNPIQSHVSNEQMQYQQNLIQLYLRTKNSKSFKLKLHEEIPLSKIKQIISSITKISIQNQSIFRKGKQLTSQFQKLKFQNGQILHIINKQKIVDKQSLKIYIKRIQDIKDKTKKKNSISHCFQISNDKKISELLEMMCQIYPFKEDKINQLFLVFVGKKLNEDKTLYQEGIEDGAQIYCVHKQRDRKVIKKSQLKSYISQSKNKNQLIKRFEQQQQKQQINKKQQLINPSLLMRVNTSNINTQQIKLKEQQQQKILQRQHIQQKQQINKVQILNDNNSIKNDKRKQQFVDEMDHRNVDSDDQQAQSPTNKKLNNLQYKAYQQNLQQNQHQDIIQGNSYSKFSSNKQQQHIQKYIQTPNFKKKNDIIDYQNNSFNKNTSPEKLKRAKTLFTNANLFNGEKQSSYRTSQDANKNICSYQIKHPQQNKNINIFDSDKIIDERDQLNTNYHNNQRRFYDSLEGLEFDQSLQNKNQQSHSQIDQKPIQVSFDSENKKQVKIITSINQLAKQCALEQSMQYSPKKNNLNKNNNNQIRIEEAQSQQSIHKNNNHFYNSKFYQDQKSDATFQAQNTNKSQIPLDSYIKDSQNNDITFNQEKDLFNNNNQDQLFKKKDDFKLIENLQNCKQIGSSYNFIDFEDLNKNQKTSKSLKSEQQLPQNFKKVQQKTECKNQQLFQELTQSGRFRANIEMQSDVKMFKNHLFKKSLQKHQNSNEQFDKQELNKLKKSSIQQELPNIIEESQAEKQQQRKKFVHLPNIKKRSLQQSQHSIRSQLNVVEQSEAGEQQETKKFTHFSIKKTNSFDENQPYVANVYSRSVQKSMSIHIQQQIQEPCQIEQPIIQQEKQQNCNQQEIKANKQTKKEEQISVKQFLKDTFDNVDQKINNEIKLIRQNEQNQGQIIQKQDKQKLQENIQQNKNINKDQNRNNQIQYIQDNYENWEQKVNKSQIEEKLQIKQENKQQVRQKQKQLLKQKQFQQIQQSQQKQSNYQNQQNQQHTKQNQQNKLNQQQKYNQILQNKLKEQKEQLQNKQYLNQKSQKQINQSQQPSPKQNFIYQPYLQQNLRQQQSNSYIKNLAQNIIQYTIKVNTCKSMEQIQNQKQILKANSNTNLNHQSNANITPIEVANDLIQTFFIVQTKNTSQPIQININNNQVDSNNNENSKKNFFIDILGLASKKQINNQNNKIQNQVQKQLQSQISQIKNVQNSSYNYNNNFLFDFLQNTNQKNIEYQKQQSNAFSQENSKNQMRNNNNSDFYDDLLINNFQRNQSDQYSGRFASYQGDDIVKNQVQSFGIPSYNIDKHNFSIKNSIKTESKKQKDQLSLQNIHVQNSIDKERGSHKASFSSFKKSNEIQLTGTDFIVPKNNQVKFPTRNDILNMYTSNTFFNAQSSKSVRSDRQKDNNNNIDFNQQKQKRFSLQNKENVNNFDNLIKLSNIITPAVSVHNQVQNNEKIEDFLKQALQKLPIGSVKKKQKSQRIENNSDSSDASIESVGQSLNCLTQ